MEELNLSIEKLINESPVDEATKHHDKSHIAELVNEDLNEVTASGVLHTDKHYRTHRIEEAAIGSIKDRLGRWSSQRNDIVLKATGAIEKQSNSELDVNKRKLHEKMEEAKSKARDGYMRDNHYADKKSAFELSKKRFEEMRAELGGKPPVKSNFLLYTFTIMMVGFIEWFINYSTFSSQYAPGIAFGFTVIVAMVIAGASHFHGALLKQRLALFSRSRTKDKKRNEVLVQSVVTVALLVAIYFVTSSRYDVLMENMVQSTGISLAGMEDDQESITGILIKFALANILVWFVGLFISYFAHDSRPDYQEAHKKYNEEKAKFYKADNGLQEEIERIGLEFDEELQKLTNSLTSHQKEIKELQVSLGRLIAKEASIIKQAVTSMNSMLEKHHSMLITEFNAKGLQGITIGPDALSIEGFKNRTVTIDAEFVRHTLSLETI